MSRLRRDVEKLKIGKSKIRDYDPEDEHDQSDEASVSGSEEEQKAALTGREHYERVGKSKLRKPETNPIDAKYAGVAVSRQALQEDLSDDDPFGTRNDDFDDEDPFAPKQDLSKSENEDSEDNIDSVDARSDDVTSESESDQSFLSAEDRRKSSDSDDDDDDDDDDDEMDEDEETEEDEDGDVPDLGQSSTIPGRSSHSSSQKREELKALLSNQAQSLASGLSQAAHADVRKGQSVKRQYQTFDRLLDARIKLQKGLLASTELTPQHESNLFGSDAEDALFQAQQAALSFFNIITSFRNSISNVTADQSSKKRKRLPTLDSLEDLDTIWHSLANVESESRVSRRKLIDKWSSKVKASDPTTIAANSRSKFLEPSHNDRLTAVLDTYTINEQDKHFRSQANEHEAVSEPATLHYDDNLFYQSLLRDLITTRAATSSAANEISLSVLPHKLHPSGNKQNKKNIDTRASKGRKIRYTIHEKLQNFMAAEGDTGRDTAMWTERGKNEFFGSLFGQDRALVEEEDDNMNVDDEINGAEVEALRLFRS